jgi:ABC-type transport system involved in multi-copper enzyme maturation permease subunit
LAWLQSRTQTVTAVGVVAALAVVAAVTGIQLSHLYSSLVAHCQAGCDLATSQFLSHDNFLQGALTLLVRLTPPLFGIFWGAPLVARELESGTYRLAWTQSTTRSRWILTKLATGALATVLVMGVLVLTVTWWYRAIDAVGTNQYDVFDARDIAPISYAVFAFAAGTVIGAVIRRTLPAMAATLGIVVFARIATMLWVRPHLLPPLHKTMSLLNTDQFGFISRNGSAVELVTKGSAPGNSWTLSSQLLTSSGHRATSAQLVAFVHQYCPAFGLPPGGGPTGHKLLQGPPGGLAAVQACRSQAAQTFHLLVTYQPATRYWPLQWLETGVFLALAALCAAGCYWWVSRRTT